MKKLMFITSSNVYDKYGDGGVKGSQKNLKLIKELFGEENTVLCTFLSEEKYVSDNEIILKRTNGVVEQLFSAMLGCKIYLPQVEKKIKRIVKEKEIDLLFIDSSIIGRLANLKGSHKTIVFYHNVESDYAWNKVKHEGLRFLPSYLASKYNDKCGMKADRVMCLNKRDSNRLKELYGREADFFIPVTFSDVFKEERVCTQYKNDLLFLGSSFAPNQLSIEWFIHEVMPKLKNVRLNIVGKGFEKFKNEYEQYENVNVIGSVQELDEYYYSHAAVVLPIKFGAGMKVKTAEAMMYGRKIFASDEALEGYEVEAVEGIVRCNTADEYIEAINHYYENADFKPYEETVRNLFLKKYETNEIAERFNVFVSEFLQKEGNSYDR